MKVNIKKLMSALVLVPVFAFAVGTAWVALPAGDAAALSAADGANAAQGDGQNPINFTGNNSVFKQVTNLLLYIVGGISVIMIVVGGFRYITSNGDSKRVEGAKNTILYAVIGLIIALAAFAIVNFVLDDLFKSA